MLVDDPSDFVEISGALDLVQSGTVQMLVLGFDPFQLRHPLTDDWLERKVTDFRVRVFPLDECYRQKANVGAQAKRVLETIALSSPFKASSKIARFRDERVGLTELANQLSFPNPHGYVEVYEDFSPEALSAETARIRHGPTWSHWPYLLVVWDDELWHIAQNRPPTNSHEVTYVRLHDVERVKGVEFQHVFVIITAKEYLRLAAGASGMGQREYDRLKLLRIPVSRAKDSLVFFVVTATE
jgi:hypothetical protein